MLSPLTPACPDEHHRPRHHPGRPSRRDRPHAHHHRPAGSRLIGELLEGGLRHVDPKQIALAVRSLPIQEIPLVHPYAVAQQLGVTAAIYLRLFAPPAEWKLAGREIAAEGCRFDLVFTRRGRRFVDQIKTGRMHDLKERVALEQQINRELAAGIAAWPGAFSGVRAVILGAPRRSAFYRPDGTVQPVEWDQNRDR